MAKRYLVFVRYKDGVYVAQVENENGILATGQSEFSKHWAIKRAINKLDALQAEIHNEPEPRFPEKWRRDITAVSDE